MQRRSLSLDKFFPSEEIVDGTMTTTISNNPRIHVFRVGAIGTGYQSFEIGVKIATVTILNGSHGKLGIGCTNRGVVGNIHNGRIIGDLGAGSVRNDSHPVHTSAHGSSWNLLDIAPQPFIQIIHEPNLEKCIPLQGAQDGSTICAPCKSIAVHRTIAWVSIYGVSDCNIGCTPGGLNVDTAIY